MKPVSTFAHGIFDYLGGFALLLTPIVFRFEGIGGPAVVVPRVLGAIILLQAVLTDYELGWFRRISMRMHLLNDYAAGVFLAISPWLLGFANEPRTVWMPHVVVGVSVLALAALTNTVPSQTTIRENRI